MAVLGVGTLRTTARGSMGLTGGGTQSEKLGPLDRANHVASAVETSLAEACMLASKPLRLRRTGCPKLAASTGARERRAERELVDTIPAIGVCFATPMSEVSVG